MTAPGLSASDVVLRFLESVGRRSEAEYYVRMFRATAPERFAALAVDADVARGAAESVVLHLRFLSDLGLYPLVVFGLVATEDAALHAQRIARRLSRAGVPVTTIGLNGALEAEDVIERAREASQSGTLPLAVWGRGAGRSIGERFERLSQVLSALGTEKLLFLHQPGGLVQGGALVPIVNLHTDYERLASSSELGRRDRTLLRQARQLVLEQVPHRLAVSITSPLNLLRELFTTKGAGTMLRRGAVIRRHATLQELDRHRLRTLLTSSFGRAPFEHFFDRPQGPVYLEESYRGCAIVTTTPWGGYLTKFAVDRAAQGEGLGRDLWDAMTADHRTLFWRSRATNPIREWYTRVSDGQVRDGQWTVFWTGIPLERVPEVASWVLAQPVDLPPPPSEVQKPSSGDS